MVVLIDAEKAHVIQFVEKYYEKKLALNAVINHDFNHLFGKVVCCYLGVCLSQSNQTTHAVHGYLADSSTPVVDSQVGEDEVFGASLTRARSFADTLTSTSSGVAYIQ